ncbi:MAG: insulinase family protein [Rickettsiales bacterium]|jgi:predicted Zn-dependent peptidase|nr:insulinase family protein [Rickettsiales bacterium]
MAEIRKLKNGVTLLAQEFKEIKSVSIHLVVNAGARNENLQNTGISHFLEHMAFKGTETRNAKQIACDFEDIGADFNAFTSKEITTYHAKVLKEYAEKALEILVDMLENSIFDEKELERERGVILQELAANNDSPSDYVYDRFWETMFPKQQVGRSILGPERNIKKFQREDFLKYLDKNYAGESIVLSMCGNIKLEEAERMAEKLFKKTKPGKKVILPKDCYVGGYYKKIKKHLEQTQCLIGFEGIPYNSQYKYALKTGNYIFGGGMSSRLFQEIREKQGLCYSICSFSVSLSDCGFFGISVATDGKKVNKVLDGILEQYRLFIKNGVKKEELERVKTIIKTSLEISKESSKNRANGNAGDYIRYGRIIPNEEIIEQINAITSDDVASLFGKIFAAKPITVAVYGNSGDVYDYDIIKDKVSG